MNKEDIAIKINKQVTNKMNTEKEIESDIKCKKKCRYCQKKQKGKSEYVNEWADEDNVRGINYL